MAELVGDWIREKCNVIHCGIDPGQYAPRDKKLRAAQDDVFDIIHVGTLHWKKGQVYLIRAMALLRDRGIHRGCE